ncbi:HELICc domain containing protein [uncultured Caudovirales phage]|uniref:HELICc domain containing protein n=1 Tax=uncultured Caudovirales phage TaxID=2100421 RepID=A0A6J5P573_9CAUD|nr:HELICc domain containing protein [uncultured Caudovirales phage]
MLANYKPKTEPFAHQWKALEASVKKVSFALFMEQGTGKTKVVLDTASYLYQKGLIDGLLVLAPNGVDEQWINRQVPAHVPDGIRIRAACWSVDRQSMVKAAMTLSAVRVEGCLAILTMNHDAVSTSRGYDCAERFLTTYRTLMVVDESHAIMTPSATRTKATIALGKLAKARRILTGTPESTGPFNLYSQFQFLDTKILNQPSFIAFKHRYGVFTTNHSWRITPSGEQKSFKYETLQHYKNVNELYDKVSPYTFSVKKADCLDLPPKMYSVLYAPLSKEQRSIYDAVKRTGIALLESHTEGSPVQLMNTELADHQQLLDAATSPGNKVTLGIKLTTMLRCQQVVGGFVTDDSGIIRPIDGSIEKCPRMQMFLSHCAASEGKVIIWALFKPELEAIVRLLNKEIGPAVGVYGGVSPKIREESIDRFRNGDARFFVSHTLACGTGLDLPMARSMIYYSTGPSYIQRAQSEDRAHRIGLAGTLSIYDMRADGVPVDQTVADILSARTDGAKVLLGWNSKEMEVRL